jgi:cyclase
LAYVRLIARLDVKSPHLIKGVHLEGLRKVGDPQEFAQRYYAQGIDEIIYIDAVASLYERNTIVDLVRRTAADVFVPITVGGGVRSIDDARALLRSGADKIAVNTAAIKDPALIKNLAEEFGSQCVVLSVQAKRQGAGWKAYTEQGREHSRRDALEWTSEGVDQGAGEVLLTSVDQEGTGSGFDIDLVRQVTNLVDVPVIASGGLGRPEHLKAVVADAGASAVAVAQVLHWNKIGLNELRDQAIGAGVPLRKVS